MRATTMAMKVRLLLGPALAVGLAGAGCGGTELVQPGTEGQACYPNQTCNSGLVCQAGTCRAGAGSDGGVATDGGGSPTIPDGFGPLPACAVPGAPCALENPCAVNPVCGADYKCRPAAVQRCDDGLDCTVDTCKGKGLCEHKIKEGSCAVPVVGPDGKGALVCLKSGERPPAEPCSECRPAESQSALSSATGGVCDDGDPCTKDDFCQAGLCKGTDFSTQCYPPGASCFKGACDGKGGCGQATIAPDSCFVNGKCWSKGELAPNGCGACEPATSQTVWISTKALCTVLSGPGDPGKCVPDGTASSDGCGVCDVSKSTTGWTMRTGICAISLIPPTPGGPPVPLECYADGKSAPGGSCAVCNVAKNPAAWTVTDGNCYIERRCLAKGDRPAPYAQELCRECDPAKSQTVWTPITGGCTMDRRCYKPGELHTSQCFTCDAAQSTTHWSVKTGVGASAQSFDAATTFPAGYTETHTDPANKVKWQVVSGARSVSGTNALYYGDPQAKSFVTAGVDNSGVLTLAPITLPASGGAALRFSLWHDTFTSSTYDPIFLRVKGGAELWRKGEPSGAPHPARTWIDVVVDLSRFKGQTLTLELSVTAESTTGTREGVYVDDVTLLTGC
ncbi:MAG: hypothetical protein IT371_25970 [Deltaproteobacteria bacterium]|nr:hypothetical protein [Deltaproteobacteria bacterium]